jgi:hypothetical protein
MMAGQSCTCPECGARLKMGRPPAPGTRIKCPSCQAVFAVPNGAPARPDGDRADRDRADRDRADRDRADRDRADHAIQAKRPPAAAGPSNTGPSRAAPPSKKRDDAPSPRNGKRRHIDQVEEVDEVDEVEDDDSDENERPSRHRPPRHRPSRRRPQKSSAGLIIGLFLGGGILLLVVLGVVFFLIMRGSGGNLQDRLIGRWQSTNAPIVVTVEFSRDGTLTQDLGFIKVAQKYRVINDTTLEIETPNPFAGPMQDFLKKLPQQQPGMPNVQFNPNDPVIRETVTVTVTPTELTIVDRIGRKTFRRVP